MGNDILTGFLAREEMLPQLNRLIRDKKVFVIGLMDLDHFKQYNDKYGHLFGDQILKYIASTIKLTFSTGSKIFRYGGDEFIIVLPQTGKKHARYLFKRCIHTIKNRPFLLGNKLFKVGASFGYAAYPKDGKSARELIDMADRAMYFAKKTGGGRMVDTGALKALKMIRILKKILFMAIIAGVLVGGFFIFDGTVFINKVKVWNMKNISWPGKNRIKISSYPVVVTLKNGNMLEGLLVDRDSGRIVIKIEAQGISGFVTIENNTIAEMHQL